jgi:hypothetical protein
MSQNDRGNLEIFLLQYIERLREKTCVSETRQNVPLGETRRARRRRRRDRQAPSGIGWLSVEVRWQSQHWIHRSLTKADERKPQFREDSIVDLCERDDTVADRRQSLSSFVFTSLETLWDVSVPCVAALLEAELKMGA